MEEARCERIGFFSSIKNFILLIMINAARSMPQNTKFGYHIQRKSLGNSFRMSQIERFVEDNISIGLTTDSIASFLHLSSKQTCRIIKETRNMSTKEYINYVRMSKAKKMLRNSTLPVRQIAEALGFTSEYYFSQFFKNIEGCPPSIFRSNYKIDG